MHQQDGLCIRVQPIEDAAFSRSEALATFVTDVPLVLLALYANVAFAFLPSCVTRQIRAKYLLWVHSASSLFQQQDFASEPTFFQPFPTFFCAATQAGNVERKDVYHACQHGPSSVLGIPRENGKGRQQKR
jgi:hypothetical protein